MSSSGTESKISVSRPGTEPDVGREAEAISTLLSNLRRLSFSKIRCITLQDDQKLCFRMWRVWRGPGWKIVLDDLDTTCNQCKKRAEELERRFRQETPPTTELADWLTGIFQEHTNFHRPSSAAETTETPASAGTIKVKGPEEKRAARIKIVSPRDESADGAKRKPGRIKVNENSITVAHPATGKVEDKRLAVGRSRTDETVRIIPYMQYPLSGGVGVRIEIPVSVCDQLIDHCRLSLEHGREVGGVMVGTNQEVRGASGNLDFYDVCVTDLIHFRAADSSGSRLHLTSDSWAHVSLEETRCGYEEQKKVRLGWYHTHPTQGIFFSKYDTDFHTVFSKLFQFALVVDPRNMEAGVFYWDDLGRRSLIGPKTFFLGMGEQSVRSATARAVYDETAGSSLKRGKLAPVRALFFAVPALLLVLSTIADARSVYLEPNQIIILSLIPVFALSLWNIDWFHPHHPLESRMLTRLQQLIDRQARTGPEKKSTGTVMRRRIIFAAVGLVLSLIVLKLIGVPSRIWPPGPRHTATPSATVENGGAEGTRGSTERVELSLRSSNNAGVMILEAVESHMEVRYQKQGGGNWSCDKQEEHDFFAHAFKWDISEKSERPYLKDLQTRLDSESSDGLWGPNTRRLFLERIKSMANGNSTMSLQTPNHKTLIVSVVEHSEDNPVSTPPVDTPAPKPRPTRPAHQPTPKRPGTTPAQSPAPVTSTPPGRTDSTSKPKPSESPKIKGEQERDQRN